MLIFGYVICGIAIFAAIPVFFSSFYFLLISLGSLIPRWRNIKKTPTTKIAILIPAHNEEKHIEKILPKIIADIDYPEELYQVIVIADNCQDSTSYLASFKGARVMERTNDWKKGKGYALEWAFGQLKKEDFHLYLILNSDTYIGKNTLKYLDAEFSEGHVAMQIPLKPETEKETWSKALSNALNAAKLYLQPRGRDRIGFSAPLTGNGSALAKEIFGKIPFEAGSKNDALEYNLKLIFQGEKVSFICGNDTAAHVEKPVNELVEIYKKGLSKKYIGLLLKEALKWNFTACEAIINMLIPPIQMTITALIVVLFAGAILFMSSSLPGCEPLVKYGTIISAISILCLLLLPVYILLGMVENRVSKKSWGALIFSPFIVVYSLLSRTINLFKDRNSNSEIEEQD